MVKPRRPVPLVRSLALLGVALAALAAIAAPAAAQVTRLKVGWCARTVSAAAAPFAIAIKLGWLRQEGIEIELVPMPGSTDCVKNVAVREVDFSLPSVEPLAVGRPQGIKAQVFYTAYQGNIYGIAVPQDSPVKDIGDLRGKRVGVISMASAGVLVARELIRTAGLDPDQDVNIVVAGEGAQTAAMVRNGQVDALSQFDTQYAMVENAGVKLRLLDTRAIDRFPSNGFLALEETLRARRKEAVALARSYAKGTVFAIANPEAAIRILWEVFPATKPTGKDEATALRDDTKVLQARAQNWRLEKAGVKRWGENSEANYQAYADFMLKTGIIKQPITAKELVTNELVDEINRFDPEKIAAEARAYRVGG
jgi:NitT/TauT family transport system substrate-binding protein